MKINLSLSLHALCSVGVPMTLADDVIALAKKHVGEKYVLGARAKFLQPDFSGPWDCAEFVSWVIFQASGERILLGCSPRNPEKGDAYTGFWGDDAAAYGLVESVETALKKKGYLLLRRPRRGKIGHIAFSQGDGRKTVEAHSKKLGVIEGKADPDSRGWDMGVRLPTPEQWQSILETKSKPQNWSLRATESAEPDPRVPAIVAALRRKKVAVSAKTLAYTDALASRVAKFQHSRGLVVDGVVGPETMRELGVTAAGSGTYNEKYKVFFDSLAGGFYSADPDDLTVRRSIRTNNPGALNISEWQKKLRGYVGFTFPDNSPDKNRTTIYRTPEHGVAAWYVLLADRYGFAKTGSFTIERLARKYAGSGASEAAVSTYVAGWRKASGNQLEGSTIIKLSSDNELLTLARAMFHHEIGKKSPLSDAQIKYGISHQRAGTLKA